MKIKLLYKIFFSFLSTSFVIIALFIITIEKYISKNKDNDTKCGLPKLLIQSYTEALREVAEGKRCPECSSCDMKTEHGTGIFEGSIFIKCLDCGNIVKLEK